ncbi:hypothetical protein Pyn_40622 [Prunus yedoensis var. nudiflora]|uniref:Uncharacterized protein n=1 Tax=Prunus yedoensis var. nudiflora TaxID=2094558 RepID=A0A314ZNZ5_PRUYE|nr:hypothetical protein Pyn_40622 [Prunus yedoensis var. nudiflora]
MSKGVPARVNSMGEDLDEDEYYSRGEGGYPDADACLEEPDTSVMPPGLASSPERRMNLEPVSKVVPIAVDMTCPSSVVGPSLPAADTTQTADKIKGAPQGVEGVPFTPPIDAAAIVTSPPPTAVIPTSTLLAIAAGTTPDYPAASIHASILADIAASTTPDLPAAPVPAPVFVDIAADTIPDLPAASTLASALLDIAAGTTSYLPAASIPADALAVSHPIGSASPKVSAVGCLSEKSMSWQDWETSFMAFKAFFDGGVKVLRSIDELLPLCYRFNGYAIFLGAFVYPETIGALRRFMDKYGCFAEVTGITSSFSRSAAFRALGLVLHGMDTMELLDITDHRLLCWRDAICEAMTLGFPVDLLLNLVRNLAHAVFGARAIDSMRSLPGSDQDKGCS